MICFHQPDTGCATDSGNDGSVVSRRQIDQERRFGRIGRSKSTRFDGVLLRVLTIVVSADFCSVRIEQIESRISEHTLHSKAGGDGPNARKQIVPSSLPFKITPAIMTLSLPPTKPRVLILSRRAIESSGYTSTRLMPVVFDLPLTIAV